MKTVVHVEFYDKEDEEMDCDPMCEVLYVDGIVRLQGDWYHDRITERIEGYLSALREFGDVTVVKQRAYASKDGLPPDDFTPGL